MDCNVDCNYGDDSVLCTLGEIPQSSVVGDCKYDRDGGSTLVRPLYRGRLYFHGAKNPSAALKKAVAREFAFQGVSNPYEIRPDAIQAKYFDEPHDCNVAWSYVEHFIGEELEDSPFGSAKGPAVYEWKFYLKAAFYQYISGTCSIGYVLPYRSCYVPLIYAPLFVSRFSWEGGSGILDCCLRTPMLLDTFEIHSRKPGDLRVERNLLFSRCSSVVEAMDHAVKIANVPFAYGKCDDVSLNGCHKLVSYRCVCTRKAIVLPITRANGLSVVGRAGLPEEVPAWLEDSSFNPHGDSDVDCYAILDEDRTPLMPYVECNELDCRCESCTL